MLVTLHVDLDERGRPADWTTEIWSATHVQRPGSGSGYLLASEALPNPPPEVAPFDPPEARGGGGTRNAVPLYDVPAHRILHHLVLRPPVRTSALRGLGALPNVFAIESLIDDLAARVGEDPVAYRLSILSEPRARRLVELVAERAGWTVARPVRHRQGAGPGLRALQEPRRLCRRGRRRHRAGDGEGRSRLVRRRCRPGGQSRRRAQPARGRHHPGRELDAEGAGASSTTQGIASRDWESYPILRFSEVPEMQVEFVDGAGNPHAGRRRMHGRPDRGRHRQCREPCARRAHSRHAAHPRAHHGGVAENLTRPCYAAAVAPRGTGSL